MIVYGILSFSLDELRHYRTHPPIDEPGLRNIVGIVDGTFVEVECPTTCDLVW